MPKDPWPTTRRSSKSLGPTFWGRRPVLGCPGGSCSAWLAHPGGISQGPWAEGELDRELPEPSSCRPRQGCTWKLANRADMNTRRSYSMLIGHCRTPQSVHGLFKSIDNTKWEHPSSHAPSLQGKSDRQSRAGQCEDTMQQQHRLWKPRVPAAGHCDCPPPGVMWGRVAPGTAQLPQAPVCLEMLPWGPAAERLTFPLQLEWPAQDLAEALPPAAQGPASVPRSPLVPIPWHMGSGACLLALFRASRPTQGETSLAASPFSAAVKLQRSAPSLLQSITKHVTGKADRWKTVYYKES